MLQFDQLRLSLEAIRVHERDSLDFLRGLEVSDLVSALEEILNSPKLLSQVAADSYIHQLKFEKYVVIKSMSGKWLRIHHWPICIENDYQDIHSHCASFASRLLTGALSHKHYRRRPGARFTEYRYSFDELTGIGESLYHGKTDLMSSDGDNLCAGDVYYVDATLLHQVSRAEAGTITVSLWDKRMKEAEVFKPAFNLIPLRSAKSGLDMQTLTAGLSNIVQKLKEANGLI